MGILDYIKSKKNKQITSIGSELGEDERLVFFKNYPTTSVENGYKIPSELLAKDYLANELPIKNYIAMVDRFNNGGYITAEMGKYLQSLMYDENNNVLPVNIFVKTISSDHRNSIFNEGIRCLGHISSGGSNVPIDIKNVSIFDSIEPFDSFVSLIGKLKSTTVISQGGNYVDETLIISIPKNLRKEDILYFCNNSNTWNIKPEYILCSVPISNNSYIDGAYFRDASLQEDIIEM